VGNSPRIITQLLQYLRGTRVADRIRHTIFKVRTLSRQVQVRLGSLRLTLIERLLLSGSIVVLSL